MALYYTQGAFATWLPALAFRCGHMKGQEVCSSCFRLYTKAHGRAGSPYIGDMLVNVTYGNWESHYNGLD